MSNLTDKMTNSLIDSVNSRMSDVEKFANKTNLSETDMIKFNLAASKYSMMVTLTSNLVKNLTDTEKQVASKM